MKEAVADDSLAVPMGAGAAVRPLSRAGALPWYCFAIVLTAACIPLGVLWDISWHQTIGRDTFWTPAHMLIYLGGTVPGLICGWLAFKTTFFGTETERAASVRFWGLRAPLGAWVTIWGALAMLTSAPLDDWWHNAYGLDVQILSPPHTVLAIGMGAVAVGAWLLMASWQNRLSEGRHQTGGLLFITISGIFLTMVTIMYTEKSYPNHQHGAEFYTLSCATYPYILVAVARAARHRWPATLAALIYSAILLAMLWILPLFRAHPKLGPIYTPVDHMVPPTFPLLFIVPAIAIDLFFMLLKKLDLPRHWSARWWVNSLVNSLIDWGWAAVLGVVFLLLFLPTHWWSSLFLLSPAADNWIFASNTHWGYVAHPGDWQTRFWDLDKDTLTWGAVGMALLFGVLSSRFGLWIGWGMARVRR
jgi:hypothetical protein